MKKVFIIIGSPRSGTTYCANIISQKFQNSTLLDELNPSRLIKFDFEYFQYLEKRSSLVRNTTKKENADRFKKIKNQFDNNSLSFERLLTSYLFSNEVTIIKYPRLLEDKSIYPFLHKLIDSSLDVYIVKIHRDQEEILTSMKSRNMYFSKFSLFSYLARKVIKFYENLEISNVMTIKTVQSFNQEKLKKVTLEDLIGINAQFNRFPRWISFLHYFMMLLRNQLGKTYWS